MAILWTNDFSVGVQKIDDQHKELIYRADKLFEAGKNGKGKEYIEQMLDYLDDYTKKHFRDEELFMFEIKYPGYEVQKKLHDNFIQEVAKLKKDFNESGGNPLVIMTANKVVVDWLIKHIFTEDRKIGEYVRANKL
ncbi:MAG: hemerythrin-like protein [Oscillospiraceae bacterium]|jgi:hemerythrin|nr:hemerythrin-like protein [Oscillospiraceae bacterium]